MGLALVLLVILIGLWWPWLRQYGRLSWRRPLGFSELIPTLIMTDDVLYWLQQALAKDPLQYTALMLQANDNFTHARYAQAIAIWQQ